MKSNFSYKFSYTFLVGWGVGRHFTKLLWFILFLNLSFSQSAFGQTLVKGRVTDISGNPMSSVTVAVKDTSIITVTDQSGVFEITVPSGSNSLVFTHVSARRKEVNVNGLTTLDVVMDADGQSLDEVVIVGFGTQRRDVVTNAISKLDNKVLENVPYSNIGNALQGNLAGVRVQSNSGQPGAGPNIVIRGGTSINNPNSSPPLYIIDGVLRSNMNDISANDIQSIQVLKDAASTAIYGAQGSNGVVIVETKSGISGKARINYSVDMIGSRVGKTYDILSAEEEVYFGRLGILATGNVNPAFLSNLDGNVYLGGAGNDLSNLTTNSLQYLTPENKHKLDEGWKSMADPVDPTKTLIFTDNDWQSLLFRNAFSHNHSLSVAGGGEKAKFYLGLGYLDNEGIAIQTDYKRLSLNLNGELKLSDKVKMGARILYANNSNRQVPTVDVFKSSLIAPRTNKQFFEDGTLSPGRNFGHSNPFYRMSVYDPKNIVNDMTMIVDAEAVLLPNLTFTPQLSYQYRSAYSRNFLSSYLNGPSTLVTSRDASGSYSSVGRPQLNGILTYHKIHNEHDVELKGGFSYVGVNNIGLSANGASAATDNIPTLNGSATPTAVSGSETSHVLIGYFSRATYNFQRKYMLNASLRYDGASNLGQNNKWGLFPGVSVGWNLDKEDFWSVLPENFMRFKLRGSYGVTGNISGLGLYQAQGEYSAASRYDGHAGIQITTLPNQDLKWERSKTMDVGFDMGLFGNRINLVFDYYHRVTDNLLTSLNLPPSTGFNSILTNYGSLQNKGYEIEVNAQVFSPQSSFQWNVAFNTADVNTTILRLPDNGIENNRVGGVYVFDPSIGDYAWLGGLQEGQRIGNLYGYKQEGIYATDSEAASGPVDMLIPRDDKSKFGGDVKWHDVDRNDTIDTRDRMYMGNSIPRISGGLMNNFSYKNISLTVRMDYTLGATIYNETIARLEGNFSGANAISGNMRKSWQNQGDITDIPRYYWADQNGQWNVWGARGNSRHYQSLDFLCLREITIGYNFPTSLAKRLGVADLRFNLTGSNLFYFTNYEGLSPEQSNTDSVYPNPRSFIFGASITF